MSLKIENLTVSLQEKEILHNVSLNMREGEFISLLGASGCGKTTLLKSIAGLLEVEEGDIRIEDQSVLNRPPEKRGTVIVFQDLRLFPHMTVEKNIAFPMEIQKIPKQMQKETVKRLLEEVQLPGFEHRKMREMSGGQMQRVALARALAANPKVLLLDEPFSGLDERLRNEMGNLVKKLHDEWKITTILVTHDKKEALQMSDRIALMDGGNILQYDTPQNMFCHPVSKTVAEYFGHVNYIAGNVLKGKFVCELFSVQTDLREGAYEAMCRPSSVKVTPEGDYMVSDITFMGETAEVKLMVKDRMIRCQMMSGALEKSGIGIGTKVGIEVEESGITWFPKGEENAEEADYI